MSAASVRQTLRSVALAVAALIALLPAARAGAVADRVATARELRVCIWPDYHGISYRDPRTESLAGIDIELSAGFAHDLGVKLAYVDSSFTRLTDDLVADRCDVGMFAIGVLPSRQAVLRFTRPYLQSDIYGITTRSSRTVRRWADIDRPGVRVAVQAGTFMQPMMADALGHATLVVIRPPQTREGELEAGRIDVFMTDYPYGRRLLANADWARMIASPTPFRVLPYAYAVRPGDEAWLRRVDAFVLAIQRDGRLAVAAGHNGLGDIVVGRP